MKLPPSLFIGHGSPMNAIEENTFTRALSDLGKRIGKPSTILCVSAHWLSAGTWITRMPAPRTIHDFYGFPRELYEIRYPAPGSREIATLIQDSVRGLRIQGDETLWGLDHGTWSVLKHMYPDADVPVLQLSIDMSEQARFHYELGRALAPLRDRGVMIVGSGNIVHNLRALEPEENAPPVSWAVEFDELIKEKLVKGDVSSLVENYDASAAGRRSVPTPDHYLPLLYAMGAGEGRPRFEFEGFQHGSISMRTVSFE